MGSLVVGSLRFDGDLPPPLSREQLLEQMGETFREHHFSESQVEQALEFLLEYENRYYEVFGEGSTYHRQCGYLLKQNGDGVFCPQCGKLPDLIPPPFLRAE